MLVFQDIIKVTQQEDEYTISIAISDNTVLTKVVTKNQLQQISSDLISLLKED